MDELIRINYDSERPTVNGRDLHEALQVKTADYRDETEGQLLRCGVKLQGPYFHFCHCQGLRQVCRLDEPLSP